LVFGIVYLIFRNIQRTKPRLLQSSRQRSTNANGRRHQPQTLHALSRGGRSMAICQHTCSPFPRSGHSTSEIVKRHQGKRKHRARITTQLIECKRCPYSPTTSGSKHSSSPTDQEDRRRPLTCISSRRRERKASGQPIPSPSTRRHLFPRQRPDCRCAGCHLRGATTQHEPCRTLPAQSQHDAPAHVTEASSYPQHTRNTTQHTHTPTHISRPHASPPTKSPI